VAQLQADEQEARRLYQESLTIFREIGHQAGLAMTHTKLGHVARTLGENAAARGSFGEAVKIAMAIQATPAALEALLGLVPLLMAAEPARQKQALEILAFILNQTAASPDQQARATRLLAEVKPHFSTEAVRVTQTSSLEGIAKRVLGE
jgi:hypothetical protein